MSLSMRKLGIRGVGHSRRLHRGKPFLIFELQRLQLSEVWTKTKGEECEDQLAARWTPTSYKNRVINVTPATDIYNKAIYGENRMSPHL